MMMNEKDEVLVVYDSPMNKCWGTELYIGGEVYNTETRMLKGENAELVIPDDPAKPKAVYENGWLQWEVGRIYVVHTESSLFSEEIRWGEGWVCLYDIRVQSLQDMTMDDFIKEGMVTINSYGNPISKGGTRRAFARIWDKAHSYQPESWWENNPEVLVLEFRAVQYANAEYTCPGCGDTLILMNKVEKRDDAGHPLEWSEEQAVCEKCNWLIVNRGYENIFVYDLNKPEGERIARCLWCGEEIPYGTGTVEHDGEKSVSFCKMCVASHCETDRWPPHEFRPFCPICGDTLIKKENGHGFCERCDWLIWNRFGWRR